MHPVPFLWWTEAQRGQEGVLGGGREHGGQSLVADNKKSSRAWLLDPWTYFSMEKGYDREMHIGLQTQCQKSKGKMPHQ